MVGLERQIAIVSVTGAPAFSLSKIRYDVYFTDMRMVFISAKVTRLWGVWFGMTEGLQQEALEEASNEGEKAERKIVSNLSLDELLSKDRMNNFEVRYEDVEKLTLYRSGWRAKEYHLWIKSKKFWGNTRNFGGMPKEDYENLLNILSAIRLLNGKIAPR